MKKKNVKKKNVTRKVNPQKIFCFVSFIFILTCCLWYGGRFVYFYLDSKKVAADTVMIADTLKTANHDKKTFRKLNDEYYFYHDTEDNYLMYSNIMWRIVKINKDNSVLLIMDEPIASLAYGTDMKYSDSPILTWLNNDSTISYSGVLENKLNDVSNYLIKNKVCTDVVDDVEKITCDNVNSDYYFGLLSMHDYIMTGGKKSFINQSSVSYLANKNKDGEVWYLGDDGTLDKSLGDDILGIRATATLSPTLGIKSGDGSKTNPYIIEDKFAYFGSYVKLGDDIWKIYDFDEKNVKLVLMNYAKDGNAKNLEYVYSKNNYRHNDTAYGSLAYYLNHTYLNSLSYKNIILDANYYNGYYGEENNYGLEEIFKDEIDTKVALLSIGDVVLNHELDNYFTSTGTYKNSTSLYVQKSNGEVTTKKVSYEASVVPCITIQKDNLKVGTGTKDDPYRTE